MLNILIIVTGLISFIALNLSVPVQADDYEAGERAVASGDYDNALKILRPLAEQGHQAAQFQLGIMYDNGLGVYQDDATAEYWYDQACPTNTSDGTGSPMRGLTAEER